MTKIEYLWKKTLKIQFFPSAVSLDSPPKEHREANKTAILGGKESFPVAPPVLNTLLSELLPVLLSSHINGSFSSSELQWLSHQPGLITLFILPKHLCVSNSQNMFWFCLQMVFAFHEITKRTFSLIALIYLPISLFVAVIRRQMISTVYFIYGIFLKIKLQNLIQMLKFMELWDPRTSLEALCRGFASCRSWVQSQRKNLKFLLLVSLQSKFGVS